MPLLCYQGRISLLWAPSNIYKGAFRKFLQVRNFLPHRRGQQGIGRPFWAYSSSQIIDFFSSSSRTTNFTFFSFFLKSAIFCILLVDKLSFVRFDPLYFLRCPKIDLVPSKFGT